MRHITRLFPKTKQGKDDLLKGLLLLSVLTAITLPKLKKSEYDELLEEQHRRYNKRPIYTKKWIQNLL